MKTLTVNLIMIKFFVNETQSLLSLGENSDCKLIYGYVLC